MCFKEKSTKKIIIDTFKNFLYLTEFNSINLNLIIAIVVIVASKTIMYDDPYLKTGNLINQMKDKKKRIFHLTKLKKLGINLKLVLMINYYYLCIL